MKTGNRQEHAHLSILTGCELHVHTAGCLFVDDLLALGKDVYQEVDWTLFVDGYEQAFGTRPNPHTLYKDAYKGNVAGLDRFRQHIVLSQADAGNFGRFQAKFNFLVCLVNHWDRVLQRGEDVLRRIIERHRREGIDYVEYRAMFGNVADDPQGFFQFHRRNAQVIQEANRDGLTARYIISLPRWAPLKGYSLVQYLFDKSPELIPVIVGLDFCFFEEGYPPETVRALFARLMEDNQQHPDRALEVVYHVGETYFDKSLESATRWCHEVAEMGARRLGHAIALGLDPAIAIARRPESHVAEPVRERLAQIAYDLEHCEALNSYGVAVDSAALERERDTLQHQPPDATIERPYTLQRLEQVRRRQNFVLDRLAELGTVIESCPTSNLRIGGVPSPAAHPLHRFLQSNVNLVIGADDPGIFDSPLASEVNWVIKHTPLDTVTLIERLGDPRQFRLGTSRP